MSDSVVLVKGLVKRYGSYTAVKGIDFEVARGRVFGLLGPNGAGKTTTLECLEGLRKSDGGSMSIAGCDPQLNKRGLRRKLGVQLQSSSLPGSMKVSEAIELICAWQGVSLRQDLIEKFNIGDLLKKQYSQLSTGQKRRLHLVLALINTPEVLVLDEPTAGLDVGSRAQLHEEIRSIKKQGITVLLATHDMSEAEELCDNIAILINGRIAVHGSPEQVTSAGNSDTRIRLRTSKGLLLPGGDIDGATFVNVKDGYLEWKSCDAAATVTEILKQVKVFGDRVEDLRVERPSLEERFLELMEGEKK
jgi:ABC-type multidrug transport system, ATPase component